MNRSWTFGRRLAAGFSLVLALALVAGAIAYVALERVVDDKDRVIREDAASLVGAERLSTAAHRMSASFRGYLLAADPTYLADMDEAIRSFDAALASLSQRGLSSSATELLGEVAAAGRAHQAELAAVADLARSAADPADVSRAFESRVAPRAAGLVEAVARFVGHQERRLEDGRASASDSAASARLLILIIVLVTILLGAAVAFYLTRNLTGHVDASVADIRSSSAELQTTASQQASGAKEQSTAMNEISTTITELLATSRQIADSAQQVAAISQEAAASARLGDDSVENAREAIGTIQQQVEAVVQHMLDLGGKSQRIGGILDLINELADQTNILAINATIEAASAGESGRRFAVVGEEIRRLADRVGGSAKEIRLLVDEMRAAVNATVMTTETGAKAVGLGTQRFSELNVSFQSIADVVERTTDAAKEIELSTKQQTTAVEQVNVAIANVAQASKEAEVGTSQTLQTASELTALSEQLLRLVRPKGAA